jgi:hypothetical protein
MKKRNDIMRKNFLKIALMIVLPLITNAQWSIVGGMTLNKSRFTDYNYIAGNGSNPIGTIVVKEFNSKIRPNFLLGIRKNQSLTEKIGFSGEVLLVNRSVNYDNFPFLYKTLRHLSVPLEMNFSITDIIKVNLGPQIDYSLNKDFRYLRKINYSANAGVSLNVSKNLELGLRLNRSIFSSIKPDFNRNFKYDFTTLQLNLYRNLRNN